MEINLKMTSEEEREIIAQELAELMKDVVYNNAIYKARNIVKNIFDINVETLEDIEICYRFLINDDVLRGFLGKARRKITCEGEIPF